DLGRPRPAHPHLVHGDVVRYPHQPAADRALRRIELITVLPGAEHRLLHYVLGQVAVLEQAVHVAQDEGAAVGVQVGDDLLWVGVRVGGQVRRPTTGWVIPDGNGSRPKCARLGHPSSPSLGSSPKRRPAGGPLAGAGLSRAPPLDTTR